MSPDDKNDLLSIQKTVENYYNGVILGDFSSVVKAWHLEGFRVLLDSEKKHIVFENSPASNEYSEYKPNSEIEQLAEIKSIDITGT